ncbi:hypothetical protein K469DRAFT_693184 [Zopfia rhizophila CBS 207.26]|uniref:Rhodopsin domain-containing protein n=1 Tax=Zopfia rhizophila CBS 207.26 TaxID=1314779 RepID=A0A6A6EPB6_9PEZI|nr:hypothetical protein K469DRAFT_693184 [Zopfia rhizophila CBS 207.26]
MRYDNPAGLIAGTVIMELFAATCIGLRFYSRRWKRCPILVTDWLILVAFVFGTGLTVMEIYGVAVKALGHPLNATIEDPRAVNGRLNKAKHLELAYLLIGVFTLGLIKLSVCFLYWHLFAKVVFRRFLMVWIIVIIGWMTSFVLAGLLECGSHLKSIFGTPAAYLHHCGSAIPSGWAMVGSDIATDFITLIIPIPVIWSLQLPTNRKILVLLSFLIGALSVGASVAKGYIYITATLGRYTEDAILILTGLSIWNLAEVQVGIIAACGPTLRPILSHILPTDSILSLMGSKRSTVGNCNHSQAHVTSAIKLHQPQLPTSTKQSDGELPSFVKMPESEEQLQKE